VGAKRSISAWLQVHVLLFWSASLGLLPPSDLGSNTSASPAGCSCPYSSFWSLLWDRGPRASPGGGDPSRTGAQQPDLTTPQGFCFHSRNESGGEIFVVAGFGPVEYALGESRIPPDVFPPQKATSRLETSASSQHGHELVHVSIFSITFKREVVVSRSRGKPIADAGIAPLAVSDLLLLAPH